MVGEFFLAKGMGFISIVCLLFFIGDAAYRGFKGSSIEYYYGLILSAFFGAMGGIFCYFAM